MLTPGGLELKQGRGIPTIPLQYLSIVRGLPRGMRTLVTSVQNLVLDGVDPAGGTALELAERRVEVAELGTRVAGNHICQPPGAVAPRPAWRLGVGLSTARLQPRCCPLLDPRLPKLSRPRHSDSRRLKACSRPDVPETSGSGETNLPAAELSSARTRVGS